MIKARALLSGVWEFWLGLAFDIALCVTNNRVQSSYKVWQADVCRCLNDLACLLRSAYFIKCTYRG
jgi:hypothetical protein